MEVEDILNQSEIKSFLDANQVARESTRRAAEQLCGKPDCIAAVKKLLPAHANKTISVFFSYKKKDEFAARKVIGQLKLYAAGKLEIFCMADFDKEIVGQNWRKWIRDKIVVSNWFILLLPDPSDDWDWCLFETGLFERGLTSADRLICIHHPETQIPDPIGDYHAVPATDEEIRKFLKMAFIEKNPIPGMDPINPAIKPYLDGSAAAIVNAIVPPKKKPYREIFEPWIELKFDAPKRVRTIDDLDQSQILSVNKGALEIFDFLRRPSSFGELRKGLPEPSETFWLGELTEIVMKVAHDRQFYPIRGVFRTNKGKCFRPVVCSVDREGDENGPVSTFHLVFLEELSTVDGTAIPKRIFGLAILLRYAFRFRFEILERFCRSNMVSEDVPRLKNALWRLARDWETRKMGGEDFVKQFYPAVEGDRISKMFVAWRELSNPDKTGKLDAAIEGNDIQSIPKLLSGVLPINQQFLEMTTDYFLKEIQN